MHIVSSLTKTSFVYLCTHKVCQYKHTALCVGACSSFDSLVNDVFPYDLISMIYQHCTKSDPRKYWPEFYVSELNQRVNFLIPLEFHRMSQYLPRHLI